MSGAPPGAAPPGPGVTAPAPSATTIYEVKPGDCLWRIIEAELDSPSDAETARLVAEIAALNPAITDPNLIYPGQELSLGKDQP
ncbi:LysM peptidoglycan-binding domain-containing protein [Bowdeniella massiliensis]|uniref:LysM peptidoglycan-binding domain-containing protein n=1 Tax=Bowdeniella massiliensis TaxID=2932264 RepID=UPI002028130A|nr:LysM domain-containing protein [Bowdeniella massiliensis]